MWKPGWMARQPGSTGITTDIFLESHVSLIFHIKFNESLFFKFNFSRHKIYYQGQSNYNPESVQKKNLKISRLIVVVKCEVVIISQFAILVILQKMKCYKIKYTAHKGVEG